MRQVKKTRVTAQFPPLDLLQRVFELGGPTGLLWKERTPDTFPSGSQQAANRWNRRFAGRPAGTLRLKPGESANPIDDEPFEAYRKRQHARTTLNEVSYAVADLVAVLATGTTFNTELYTVIHDDGDQWNCDPAHLSIVSQEHSTHPAPYVIRRLSPGTEHLRRGRLSPLKTLVWDTFIERPGVLLRKPSLYSEVNLMTGNRENYGPAVYLKDHVSLPEGFIRRCAEEPPNLVRLRTYVTSKPIQAYPRRFGKQFLKYLLEEFPQFFKLRSKRVFISGNPRMWREEMVKRLVGSGKIKYPSPLELPMEFSWRQFDADPDGKLLVVMDATGEVIGTRLPKIQEGQASSLVNRNQPGPANPQYQDAPPGWVMPPPPPGFEPATKDRPAGRFVAPVEPVVLPWNEDPNYWDHSTAEPSIEEDDDESPADLRVVR